MSDERFVPVPGSMRRPVPAAKPAGGPDPAATVDITLVLRRRTALPRSLVEGRATVGRDAFAERYGADPEDLRLVHRALAEHGLTTVATDPASRRVQVRGPLAVLSDVFGTRLEQVEVAHPYREGAECAHRYRSGALRMPAELADVVIAVLGLDDRPQAHPYLRVAPRAEVRRSFPPGELGTVYRFPGGTDGSGHTVAIVELGGGFSQNDLTTYFTGLGLAPPTVTAVGVDGADNMPGADPNGADGEVLLDIEVTGALAPGANQVVYFAPNTDQGFVDAVSAAIHAEPTPVALSISWGAAEDAWTEQARHSLDAVLADAAALGVTVTAAAGDAGSSDGAPDGAAHTDFPASSPHVLACGGTSLDIDEQGTIDEAVWNGGTRGGATGGGVSTAFGVPAWQRNAGVPALPGGARGRGVPDVAANADPATGYEVLVNGKQLVVGGTSAVAPLWAALVARLAQYTGRRLGLLQATLYAGAAEGQPTPGFRDIIRGDNGAYEATPGWDPCTGLGVPDGAELARIV